MFKENLKQLKQLMFKIDSEGYLFLMVSFFLKIDYGKFFFFKKMIMVSFLK
jgi:hypothetical protein